MNNGEQFFNTAAGGGYAISRSLRFNSSDSAYLSRVFGTPTDAKKQTYSFWIKRSNLGQIGGFERAITNAYTGGSTATGIYLYNDSIQVTVTNAGDNVRSTALFRDVSAWYHFVVSVDTTQATAANRVRIYVNGAEITQFASASYPAQNSVTQFANSSTSRIGTLFNAGGYWYDGLIAEFHFIDGQALTPTSFGEFSATTGVWMPKAYPGTYGTNGFRLDFSDNSAATATTLGKDAAGSNNWTPNNFSVTAGADNDSLVDVPTNGSEVDTGLGGQVRGNYCTWNPLVGINRSLANGNFDSSITSSAADGAAYANFGLSSGKWYYENSVTSITANGGGISIYSQSAVGSINGTQSRGYFSNGQKYSNGSLASYGNSFGGADVIGVAVDVDAGKVWFSKNGTWQASGDPAAGTNAAYTDIAANTWFPVMQAAFPFTVALNAGQRPFAYTAPSGFKALCTANLPTPTIVKPSTVMDVALYTGNGSTQTISGLGFSPDLVWIKCRSTGSLSNILQDTVRGVNKTLFSDLTDGESTANYLTSFNSDGFGVDGTTFNPTNQNGQTYVGWTWDAGSSTVTNTQGSISSQVRANASAGFSIVTYTGNGGASTIGHGLGVAPSLIIIKSRSSTDGWPVYHASVGNTAFLYLNQTSASVTNSAAWNNTSPTSSVFTVGFGTLMNTNGNNHVAYCFAPVAGYSAFGSYTGNGSADGPFVYTGFRPRYIMVKSSSIGGSSGYDWIIHDTARSAYNLSDTQLIANSSVVENQDSGGASTAGFGWDILSNGFKIRTSTGGRNQSGQTYIYAAFAESPFQYARAR